MRPSLSIEIYRRCWINVGRNSSVVFPSIVGKRRKIVGKSSEKAVDFPELGRLSVDRILSPLCLFVTLDRRKTSEKAEILTRRGQENRRKNVGKPSEKRRKNVGKTSEKAEDPGGGPQAENLGAKVRLAATALLAPGGFPTCVFLPVATALLAPGGF